MKKAALVLAISIAASFCSFAEIVSWKGMEMGLPLNPKWVRAYRQKKDERPLRKKFDLSASDRLAVGVGKADDLETARSLSQVDAEGQLADLKSSGQDALVKAARLEPLGEYWEEDSDLGFTVYSFYSY